MNGDVFLSEEALEKILREKESPVLFYDTRRCEGADYRFHCEGDRLVNFGKHLSAEDTSGEYIGCARIDQSFVPPFLDRMKLLIGTQQHGKWWEDVLYSFSSERKIVARDIAGAFWAEVDYIEDYTRIIDFYDVRRREHHAETPAAVPRETGAKAHLLDYGLTQVK
jgi:choline kinase